MLDLDVSFDDGKSTQRVQISYCLRALAKWEAKWEIPFFGPDEKTKDQQMHFLDCMVLTPNVPSSLWQKLTKAQFDEISEYMGSKHTATTFPPDPTAKPSREIRTAEVMYQWLVQFRIPFSEVETWHINQMVALIRTCGIKASPPKKMSNKERHEMYAKLNEQRRQEFGTNG